MSSSRLYFFYLLRKTPTHTHIHKKTFRVARLKTFVFFELCPGRDFNISRNSTMSRPRLQDFKTKKFNIFLIFVSQVEAWHDQKNRENLEFLETLMLWPRHGSKNLGCLDFLDFVGSRSLPKIDSDWRLSALRAFAGHWRALPLTFRSPTYICYPFTASQPLVRTITIVHIFKISKFVWTMLRPGHGSGRSWDLEILAQAWFKQILKSWFSWVFLFKMHSFFLIWNKKYFRKHRDLFKNLFCWKYVLLFKLGLPFLFKVFAFSFQYNYTLLTSESWFDTCFPFDQTPFFHFSF